MATLPWNKSDKVTIIKAEQGTMLSLRRSQPEDNAQYVFGVDELESLFATLAGAKRPVKSDNFILYGEKIDPETKRPAVVPAQHVREYKGKTYNFAYSAKQIDEFVAKSFALRVKFVKINGRSIPQPLFIASATVYERERGASDLGFQRVSVGKVSDKATDEPEIKRVAKR